MTRSREGDNASPGVIRMGRDLFLSTKTGSRECRKRNRARSICFTAGQVGNSREGRDLMSTLIIELSKTASGDAVLKCVRPDCSVTWQRNNGRRAVFFPLHDLTHYAVESVLAAEQAFYGLIARGWEIADTTGKGARGPLPDEAIAIEHLVGLLDAERMSETRITAPEVNAYCAAFASTRGRAELPTLTEDILESIRASVSLLHAQWRQLPVGETMTLIFPPSPLVSASMATAWRVDQS